LLFVALFIGGNWVAGEYNRPKSKELHQGILGDRVNAAQSSPQDASSKRAIAERYSDDGPTMALTTKLNRVAV
jgi:hypothetical protein